jgi:hypothetical protein
VNQATDLARLRVELDAGYKPCEGEAKAIYQASLITPARALAHSQS